MSTTPRLDAVKAWLDAGCRGEIVVPPDPPGWATFTSDEHRLRVAVARCCSGARARLPERHIIDTRTGRILPPPPRSRRRRKKQ
jgi:hypothetical protein